MAEDCVVGQSCHGLRDAGLARTSEKMARLVEGWSSVLRTVARWHLCRPVVVLGSSSRQVFLAQDGLEVG
jgi:hypothetical protein